MSEFKLTDEQQEIVDLFNQGWSFVVEAGAGTGKTFTLAQGAQVSPGRNRGLYMAYNKAIVNDAKGAFGDGVVCSTVHSLAYRAVGHHYREQLTVGSIQGWQIAKNLGVRRWAGGGFKMSGPSVASLARRTVKAWAGSTDPEILSSHVPVPDNIRADRDATASLRHTVLSYARQLWTIARDPRQRLLRFDPDWYLKLFSMSGHGGGVPILPVSLLLFDECQDADPVIRFIFEGQMCQRVAVGDSSQAIYAWRGAENAIARFRDAGAPVRTLTTSWRFGETIASEANAWLDVLDADIRLTGNPALASTIGEVDRDQRHAVLCRTNAGVMEAVISALADGRSVAMVGGGKDVKALAGALDKLYHGKETDHQELIGFDTWDSLVEFTDSRDCDNPTLRTLVRLSSTYTTEGIRKALDGCVEERDAQVVVSTAHKAKGRQWDQVLVSGDFSGSKNLSNSVEPSLEKPALRLGYVTVTRARGVLDDSRMRVEDTVEGI